MLSSLHFSLCRIVDKHIRIIVGKYLDTKFIKVDAEVSGRKLHLSRACGQQPLGAGPLRATRSNRQSIKFPEGAVLALVFANVYHGAS